MNHYFIDDSQEWMHQWCSHKYNNIYLNKNIMINVLYEFYYDKLISENALNLLILEINDGI